MDSAHHVSFDGRQAERKLKARLFCAESEEFHSRIWTQLRNDETPSIAVVAKTNDDIPHCVNAVHFVDIGEVHHLLLFNSTSDMVNEENKEAGSILAN